MILSEPWEKKEHVHGNCNLDEVRRVRGQQLGEEWGHFICRGSTVEQLVQQGLEDEARALINESDLRLAALWPEQIL